MSNIVFRATFLTMLILQWVASRGTAFQLNSATVRRRGTTTVLNAWSLPNPSMQSSFGSLTNTWYNEVKNPTHRTTVYNDLPTEYKFVTLGSDWPSIGDRSSPSVVETDVIAKPRHRLAIPQVFRRLARGRRGASNQS